jgi:hypothetical protein
MRIKLTTLFLNLITLVAGVLMGFMFIVCWIYDEHEIANNAFLFWGVK